MTRKQKIVLLTSVILLGVLGISLLLRKSLQPSASIQFTKASLENGQLDLAYSYSHSSGTSLVETEISNGQVTGGSSDAGTSLFWFPSTGDGVEKRGLDSDFDPASKPVLLVQIGKTYKIDFNTKLLVYSFTNKSGGAYKFEFSLKPFK